MIKNKHTDLTASSLRIFENNFFSCTYAFSTIVLQISVKELRLDLGEDRIVIESTSKNYLLDIFIPLVIRQSSCTSTFNKSTKVSSCYDSNTFCLNMYFISDFNSNNASRRRLNLLNVSYH
jgi:hypothetical protein